MLRYHPNPIFLLFIFSLLPHWGIISIYYFISVGVKWVVVGLQFVIRMYLQSDYEARCKGMLLDDGFTRLLVNKIKLFRSTDLLGPAFGSFFRYRHYTNDIWAYFKLMLTLDLCELIDILYANTSTIFAFADKLYAPHHHTSLNTDKSSTNDNTVEMSEKLILDKYKGTQLSYLLKLVIGLHLDIKEQSLINPALYYNIQNRRKTVFDSKKIYEGYETIGKIIKQMRTYILIKNLSEDDCNIYIATDENTFILEYEESSQSFKKNFQFMKLALELELILSEQQAYFVPRGIQADRNILSPAQTLRAQEIANELIENDQSGILRLMNIKAIEEIKTQKLDLIKFKAIQYLLLNYEVNGREREIRIIKLLFKLHLFRRQNAHSRFVLISQLVERALTETELVVNQNYLSFYQSINSQHPDSPYVQLGRIFDEVDATIAGGICLEWTQRRKAEFEQSPNLVIIIGRTGIGKSSLINFLSHERVAVVGTNRQSTTFFPSIYQIASISEGWSVCDLPGFMDNRTFIHKLCVCFFLNYVMENSREVKFLFVTNFETFETNGFQNLMKYFSSILDCQHQAIDSLSFIFSFVDSQRSGKNRVRQERARPRSQNQLQNLKHALNHLGKNHDQINLFYQRLLTQLSSSYSLFTSDNFEQDNQAERQEQQQHSQNSEGQQDQGRITASNKKNREKILATINSLPSMKSYRFNPSIFLTAEQAQKIRYLHNEVNEEARKHLSKNRKNFKSFIELYDIVEIFNRADKRELILCYETQRQKLENQYEKIYKHYLELNKAEEKDKKMSIEMIMRSHVRKQYFKTFEESLKQTVEGIVSERWANRVIFRIWKELTSLIGNTQVIADCENKINTMEDISLSSPEKEAHKHQFYLIIEEIRKQAKAHTFELNAAEYPNLEAANLNQLNQVFKVFKRQILNEEESVLRVIEYLTLLIEAKETKLTPKIMQSIRHTQEHLLETQDRFLKDDYRDIFREQQEESKFDKVITCSQANLSQRIFLKILYLFKKGNVNEEMLMNVDYYLELLSRQNYQQKSSLEYKKNRIIKSNEMKASKASKTWRLNNYGECYCSQEVLLSEVCEVNSKKTENGWYNFLQYQDVRIYCKKIIFDHEKIRIVCKNSFNIIAEEIEIDNKLKYDIVVRTHKQGNATTIIIDKSNSEIVEKALVEGFKKGRENSQTLPKHNKEIVLVSRTLFADGVFLQKYQIIPRFTYIIRENEFDNPVKTSYLKKKVTIQKLLEFGELHLIKTTLQKRLKPGSKLRIEEFKSGQTLLEKEIIQYVIKEFNKTSIKLRYQLFSNSFCQKIAVLIMGYNNTNQEIVGENESKLALMNSCFQMMKDHMHRHIYRYILDESLKDTKYGRYFIYQSSQVYSASIKSYCESLLSFTISEIEKKFEEEETFLALTKKFIVEFENKILFAAQEQLSFLKKIKGLFKILLDSATKQSQEIFDQTSSPFIEFEITREKDLLKHFSSRNSEAKIMSKENQENNIIPDHYSGSFWLQSILKKSKDLTASRLQQQKDDSSLELIRNQIIKDVANHNFKSVIDQYQNPQHSYYVFHQKLDEIHSTIAQAYLKSLQFSKVENELSLLPSSIDSINKTKIIFDVIKLKYKHREERLLSKKELSAVEIATFEYFANPFKNKKDNIPEEKLKEMARHGIETKYNYLERSMQKRINSNRQEYNIISFDSSRFQNNVINVIFAAEIEKCTHRPIMHMFDAIVGKNSSAFIASLLATPALSKHTECYSKNYMPIFSASEFIYQCQHQIDELSELLTIKTFIANHKLDELDNHVVLMRQFNNRKEVYTPFTYKQYKNSIQNRPLVNLYDFTSLTIESKGKQTSTDPLLHVCTPEYIPALSSKSQAKINILSLGSGTNLKQQNFTSEWQLNYGHKQLNRYNRWQIQFDGSTEISKLRVDDYIEHARIFLEEKWIQSTKEMRDLLDILEDKTSPEHRIY